MRLVDAVLRQGHLSERALTDAIVTGEAPAHLGRCDLCAERARELSRWLHSVHQAAAEAADQAFPPERLAAQQAQVLRRLEQLDEPARVITFPGQPRVVDPGRPRRLVSPAWVGAAAAAGLLLGLVGGQVTARLEAPPAADSAVRTPASSPAMVDPQSNPVLEWDLDRIMPSPLADIDEATPTMVPVSIVSQTR